MFFCAIMYSDASVFSESIKLLSSYFGKAQDMSDEFDFNFTEYYAPEFGANLKKRFVIYSLPIATLAEARLNTGKIEDILSSNGKRTVNIDPGIISKGGVIVASLKKMPFKEYLGDGVYAHKVLEFHDGEVLSFKHTFADYRKNVDFFKRYI